MQKGVGVNVVQPGDIVKLPAQELHTLTEHCERAKNTLEYNVENSMETLLTSSTHVGTRDTNEDRFVIRRFNDGSVLLAIFDGHNGDRAADWCARYLKAFLYTGAWDIQPEIEMRHLFSGLRKGTDFMPSGTTASIAYICPTATCVTVGVIGDSPVLIRRNKTHFEMSPRHNYSFDLKGREHVIRNGGEIVGGGYVSPKGHTKSIAITRALGDAWAGDMLLREPEIYTRRLNPRAFVLLASDGFTARGEEPEPEAIAEMIRCGSDAEQLITWRAREYGGLKDNTTVLLWKRVD